MRTPVRTDAIHVMQAETTHVAPGCQLNPHDFAITDDYYVFFENRGNKQLIRSECAQLSTTLALSNVPVDSSICVAVHFDGYSASVPL
jgi:hypothetical protein